MAERKYASLEGKMRLFEDLKKDKTVRKSKVKSKKIKSKKTSIRKTTPAKAKKTKSKTISDTKLNKWKEKTGYTGDNALRDYMNAQRGLTRRKPASKNRKGLSVEDSRSIGLTGTRKRENDAKIRANKAKREAALEKDRLAEKAKMEKAEKVSGAIITGATTVPLVRAGVLGAGAAKAGFGKIGGVQGVGKNAKKIKDTATRKVDTRTDAQKYLGLKNKGENVLQTAGRTAKEIPKMLRQQKGNVKRKKTIDAKKEAARKEAARKEAESKRLQLFGGFKRGGVFKGTF